MPPVSGLNTCGGALFTSADSLIFDLSVGDDERRGPNPARWPRQLKAEVGERLAGLRANGLSADAEYAVDTYLTVADAFEADGQLVQAVDCLADLLDQLTQLVASRAGSIDGLIATDADLLPYRDRHNVHAVDARYLTGAQPTERGYRWLQSKGVTTVISLRLHADDDRKTVENLGMQYLQVAWADEQTPSVGQVRDVLEAVTAADGRVFQHCLRGIGRDLTMAGCYQVAAGGDVEDILAQAQTEAPRWAADQQLDPETGEPVQFQLLRCFAAEHRAR